MQGVRGDVLLQGAGATLALARANSDAITPLGQFHGIAGTILAGVLALLIHRRRKR